MIHATLIKELCAAQSADWRKLIERHEAVEAYLQMPRASTVDVDRFAARTGLSRRMFYRLIARRREQMSGVSVPKKSLSRGRPLTAEQTGVIAEAISNVPPGGLCKDTIEEVVRLSLARQQPVPSDFAIINRMRGRHDLAGLQARLSGSSRLIIDACSTDLDVQVDNEVSTAAWLLALIESKTGRILAHMVCGGPPDPLILASFALASHGQLKGWKGEKKISVTASIAGAAHILRPLLAEYGFVTCQVGRPLRPGEALYLLLGQQLGRIRLRPRPRRKVFPKGSSGVPMNVADAVVGHLIDDTDATRTRAYQAALR